MSSIEDRVARGVALLDRDKPGWVDMVDLETLALSHHLQCVLGQLYGGYNIATSKFGFDMQNASDHGFQTRQCRPRAALIDAHLNGRNDYAALTAEWRRVIGILRQKTATEVTVMERELVHV